MAFSQGKGSLSIDADLEEDYHGKKRIEFVLLKHDTIIKKDLHVPSYDGDWIVDSLHQGNYQFKILLNDSVYFSFTNIIIVAQKKNNYDFNISSYKTTLDKGKSLIDTINVHDDKGEFTFGGMYGNNTNEQANKILQNEIFSGEIATNVYHTLFKYYSIGFKVGYQYGATVFHNDTTQYNGGKIMQKYYSYNDLNIGLINRFTFFNNHKNKDGLKLDVGLIYHFPISFKQILKVNDDTKIITRHIHTYTDFTAMVRLGYKYVGLQAEYSLTQFLRHGYTEIPQLRVGLVFYIPVVVD
jgi:hypothetical protein